VNRVNFSLFRKSFTSFALFLPPSKDLFEFWIA